jgi:hypothetical protein
MIKKKKKLVWWVGGTLLVLVLLAGLGLVLKHEPGYFRRCAVPAGKERKDLSNAFFGRFTHLVNCVVDGGKDEWEVTFSEAQINSYFEEDFVRLGDAEVLKKHGISEPRLSFEQDRIRLAFRLGSGLWSTVLSYDLRVWLAPKEVNVVVVEILGRQAGALPLSTQSLHKELGDIAERHNMKVEWYRHQGNPVAVIHFQPDRRPTAQLQRLEVRMGSLTLGGVSLDPAAITAGLNAQTPRGF